MTRSLGAIGQGDVLATPLQVAHAYAAIANGGTLYRPQVARAVMSPEGKVVKNFKPKSQGKVAGVERDGEVHPGRPGQVPVSGSAAYRYVDFPLTQLPVAAKTGTGQVDGKATTSWYASYAPADDPEYVVLMMVPEGGTGSGTSAPSVNEIYKALFGIEGSQRRSRRTRSSPAVTRSRTLPTSQPRRHHRDARRTTGCPASPQSGIPAANTDDKKPKKNGRRRRRDGRMTLGYPQTVLSPRRRRQSLRARAMGRDSLMRRFDWVLFVAALGTERRRGASSSTRRRAWCRRGRTRRRTSSATCINLVIGLVLGFATMLFDYRTLRAYAPFVYVASVIGLVAVLVVGTEVNGAQAWIQLPGGFSIQPSEFMKVALAVGSGHAAGGATRR